MLKETHTHSSCSAAFDRNQRDCKLQYPREQTRAQNAPGGFAALGRNQENLLQILVVALLIDRLVEVGVLRELDGVTPKTFYSPEVFNAAYEDPEEPETQGTQHGP